MVVVCCLVGGCMPVAVANGSIQLLLHAMLSRTSDHTTSPSQTIKAIHGCHHLLSWHQQASPRPGGVVGVL